MSGLAKFLVTVIMIIGFFLIFGALVIKKEQSGNSAYIALAAIITLGLIAGIKAVWKKPKEKNVNDDFEKNHSQIPRKRELLKETFESGLISQNELNEKLELIKNEEQLLESKLKENEFNSRIENEIKIGKEKLLELKRQGLLTEKEYNDKVDFLYKKQIEINENERLREEKQLEIENGFELSETTENILVGGAIVIILLFAAFRYFTS